MSAKDARAVAEAFIDPLRQAIACVTHAYTTAGYRTNAEQILTLFPGPVLGVGLAGQQGVRLQVQHFYRIHAVESWRWVAFTTAYSYVLEVVTGPEIVAYHYDPRPDTRQVPNPYPLPHLHVRGLTRPMLMSKAHFPTDHVSLQTVLLFAIRELGVTATRPDAIKILEDGDRRFRQGRRTVSS